MKDYLKSGNCKKYC